MVSFGMFASGDNYSSACKHNENHMLCFSFFRLRLREFSIGWNPFDFVSDSKASSDADRGLHCICQLQVRHYVYQFKYAFACIRKLHFDPIFNPHRSAWRSIFSHKSVRLKRYTHIYRILSHTH